MNKVSANKEQIKFLAKSRVILSGELFIKLLKDVLKIDGLTKTQANQIRNKAIAYYNGKIELNNIDLSEVL